MIHIKLQLFCIAALLYIAFVYFRDSRMFKHRIRHRFFLKLLALSLATLVLDTVTTYTVNLLETVPRAMNVLLHGAFYVAIVSLVYVMSLYILKICGAIPKKTVYKALLNIPFYVGTLIIILNLPSVQFIYGEETNYSTGASVYASIITVYLYIVLLAGIIAKHWQYLESLKKVSLITFLFILVVVATCQAIFPESMIMSMGVMLLVIAVYTNLDDPALRELARHDNDAIMAFADLIENRDNSTGGHIKRTSIYVRLIAEELRRRGMYHDILTNDYVANLIKASPMHDIGKVAIPDSILQKPGRLTAEEFEIMKGHSAAGGKIIKESFANLGTSEFRKMAYELALYHHEKWNGKGYPGGLAGTEIPLGARILTVADVFDALSEKRVYRDAMPLEECFRIIEEGSGTDFEPLIVDCFLSVRAEVEKVHHKPDVVTA